MGDFGIHTNTQLDALHDATFLTHPISYPKDLVYVIYLKSNQDENEEEVVIGAVRLGQRSPKIPPDIGWALLPLYMGKGYATEVAREFLRWVVDE